MCLSYYLLCSWLALAFAQASSFESLGDSSDDSLALSNKSFSSANVSSNLHDIYIGVPLPVALAPLYINLTGLADSGHGFDSVLERMGRLPTSISAGVAFELMCWLEHRFLVPFLGLARPPTPSDGHRNLRKCERTGGGQTRRTKGLFAKAFIMPYIFDENGNNMNQYFDLLYVCQIDAQSAAVTTAANPQCFPWLLSTVSSSL
ncbi:hypothetical protein C8J57DRAFT_1255649 [Mycena rebaudengoi]|nr:hypothetical protein C8J57DRAFT_1255649 [Mycena rebaudengoi]